MLIFLTIYWGILWGPYPTCQPRWKSNYLQGREEGSSARMISGSPNSTPRKGVAEAEEEAAGGEVTATTVTTMDITCMTHPIAGFMEWNDTDSGGVSPKKILTRMGVMGAYMYSTRARVTRTLTTSIRFRKAGKMMGWSYLLCHIPE